MTVVVMAQGIDRNTALKKAQEFMPGKQFFAGKTIPSARAKAPMKHDAFYIFNAVDNDGYVIVSGDDRTVAILGYSKHGTLDVDQLPSNLQWWLDNYARQIEALGTSLKPAQRQKVVQGAAIEPLITAQWDQSTPYNYMCPDGSYTDYNQSGYNKSNRCITGCVATAMAQVMYYWQWPKSCPAIKSYQIDNYTIRALPATTFKWDDMKSYYTQYETGPAADAVAELMRYCGQSVEMHYTTYASAAYCDPSVLASVFQYSPNCRELWRDHYNTDEWESIIYNELAEQRPVLYSGQNGSTGHEFVVDGYDGDGYFHINWGWGGLPDSYYVLSLADPEVYYEPFQYYQDAIIGLKPAVEGEVMLPIMDGNPDWTPVVMVKRDNSDESFDDIYMSGIVFAFYNREPTSEQNVEIGWALYQEDNLVKVLSSENMKIGTDLHNYLDNDFTVSIGADVAEGSYQIHQIYRLNGQTEWNRCGNLYLSAEVTSHSLTIQNPRMSFKVNRIIPYGQPEVENEIKLQANITNTGKTGHLFVGLWMKKQESSLWTHLNVFNEYIEEGNSQLVILPFVPEEAGTYNLKITAGSTENSLGKINLVVPPCEKVTIDDITYLCTPQYKRAKVVRNPLDHYIENPTILSSVNVGGIDHQVTGIQEDAFYSAWWITNTLLLPEGIESVGKWAVSSCYNLKKIVLPSTITNIEEYAFSNNPNLQSVVSHIQDPPEISDNTFFDRSWNSDTQQYNNSPSPATLYVPIGTKAKYENISGWTQFANIMESEEATNGILMMESEAPHDGSWYNLQGIKVNNPTKGVFVRNGRKVVLR